MIPSQAFRKLPSILPGVHPSSAKFHRCHRSKVCSWTRAAWPDRAVRRGQGSPLLAVINQQPRATTTIDVCVALNYYCYYLLLLVLLLLFIIIVYC